LFDGLFEPANISISLTIKNIFPRWEENTYCAEPMFIPRPESQGGSGDEDDGILISSMIRGGY
jgi:hypothetical protein